MYTVLAITSHPDDMEFVCAGTLLKCKERGDRVVVCYLCSGNMGSFDIEPDELKKIRAQEAANAAKIAGFELIYGGFDDLDIYDNNKEARDKLTDIIKEVKPDFILAHDPDDYMPDHNAASRLAFDASFAASVPHYPSKLVNTDTAVCPIYYFGTANGIGFNPTEYVDVTPYIDTIVKMMACHKSQYAWLNQHANHADIGESVKIVTAFRGLQCGVKNAEGFRQCLVNQKIVTKRLLP